MKIYVLSRAFLEHYRSDPKYVDAANALISITDPGSKPAIHPHVTFDHKLTLSFYDIHSDTYDDVNKKVYKAITDGQVLIIRDFVNLIEKANVGVLIVQCEAGISRSAGVAGAIAKIINGNNDFIFKSGKFVPNMTVYSKVLGSLHNIMLDTE
jgi:predicted protein tyrosine phosphatase